MVYGATLERRIRGGSREERRCTDQITLYSKSSKTKKYVVILADYWAKRQGKTHQEWVANSKQGVLTDFAQVAAHVGAPKWRARKMGLKSGSSDYYLLSMIGEI